MTRRPSRPIQASRLHGARWAYGTDGDFAWWALASADMRYGTVELLPLRGVRRWHATLTSALVDITDCVDGHVRRGQMFRTKKQAMRYLEIVAIAAWRRVLIAAAKKVAKMKAQDALDAKLMIAFAAIAAHDDRVEPLPWAAEMAARSASGPGAYVAWIDQSGNGRHAVRPTPTAPELGS